MFFLEMPDLGELSAIKIGHDNAGLGPGWCLDRVIVSDEDAPGDASDEDFEAAPAPKPKKAPKDEDEEPVETEVVMRKMNPFIYFSQQKRAAVKAEVESSINEEATPQERNREVLARIGVLWKALSDADKQKWKDEAPEKETTVKKRKKKSAGGTPKGAKK